MIRITPGMQMLYIDEKIILIDMQKLEKALGLDAILQNETIIIMESIEIYKTEDGCLFGIKENALTYEEEYSRLKECLPDFFKPLHSMKQYNQIEIVHVIQGLSNIIRRNIVRFAFKIPENTYADINVVAESLLTGNSDKQLAYEDVVRKLHRYAAYYRFPNDMLFTKWNRPTFVDRIIAGLRRINFSTGTLV